MKINLLLKQLAIMRNYESEFKIISSETIKD
jgi:hypothetical protein